MWEKGFERVAGGKEKTCQVIGEQRTVSGVGVSILWRKRWCFSSLSNPGPASDGIKESSGILNIS